MVAYLATEDCPITNELFYVAGDTVARYQPHVLIDDIRNDGRRWTVEQLMDQAPKLTAAARRGGQSEVQRLRAKD
jgi:hypothetical protein